MGGEGEPFAFCGVLGKEVGKRKSASLGRRQALLYLRSGEIICLLCTTITVERREQRRKFDPGI